MSTQEITEPKQDRRFVASYRKRVELGGNKKCTLKRHFRGGLREVVGFLDLLASKDPERFVWPHVSTIVAHCRKFGKKDQYNERWVQYALAYLRSRHMISSRVTRLRNGMWHEGFIVADHDGLTDQPTKTACIYMGIGAMKNCWTQDENGHVFWVKDASKSAPHSAPHSAPLPPAQQCTPELPQVTDIKHDVGAQKTLGGPENSPSLGSVLAGCNPENRKERKTQEESSDQVAVQKQRQHLGAAAPNPVAKAGTDSFYTSSDAGLQPAPGTDQAVGSWFENVPDNLLLQAITDGGYTSKDVGAYYQYAGTLMAACKEAIATRAAALFVGRATCAVLMEDVIKILQRTNAQYPPAWLRVKKELAKTPGPCKRVEAVKSKPQWQTHDGPPNAQDAKANNSGDWELCEDWIRRDPAGRAATGYTEKRDGVWCKTQHN